MGRLLVIFLSLAALAGCSCDKKDKNDGAPPDAALPQGIGQAASEAPAGPPETTEVAEIFVTPTAAGGGLVLLDGAALTETYRRVFGNTPRRTEWGGYFGRNPQAFFTPDQLYALGTHNIVDLTRPRRMRALRQPDVEYFRAMRDFLGEACGKLAWAEVDGGSSDPVLIRGSLPEASAINEFMTLMFGYEPSESRYHAGAAEYHKIMSSLLSINYDGTPYWSSGEQVDAYTLLCIAVGSDPRVYSR